MAAARSIEAWIERATRGLAEESAQQARAELEAHYRAAYEDRIAQGESPQAALVSALQAMGDPSDANREYRSALMTDCEAKFIAAANGETRHIGRACGWLSFSSPRVWSLTESE